MSSASSLLLPSLNHDIMNRIFTLNTQRDRDISDSRQLSALDTTRISSHVCRAWRQLILQSPVIWGNIIDLQALSMTSEEWFEEVIKRTGKTKLSIYGQCQHIPTINRLVLLLEENWDRVRCIDILVEEEEYWQCQEIDLDCFHDIIWNRPAPSLEKFSVCIAGQDRRGPNERQSEDLKLFSGSAPLLRCINSPGLHFDQHAPWISQLVDMTLTSPPKIYDALSVIANTPLLEKLGIESMVRDDDSAKGWNQNINLPNLHHLKMTSNVAGSLIYLSHITPRSDCALMLEIADNSFNVQGSKKAELPRLSKIISPYVEGYSRVHCPQKLYVHIGENSIGFWFYDRWDDTNDSGSIKPNFQVTMSADSVLRAFDPPVVNMLLSTLVPTTLNKVLTFELTVFQSWMPESSDAFIHIIRSLTAVKNMTVTPWAMHGLNNLSDSATFFPKLADVTIEYQAKVRNFDHALYLFLTRRRNAGKPLKTLYKPDNFCPQGAEHWAFLNQFEGLRVISTGYTVNDDSDDSEDWKDGDWNDSDGQDDEWDDREDYNDDKGYEEEEEESQ